MKCEATSCLPNVVIDGAVSMCDDIDGQCKCGAAKNAACISTSSQPKCLVTAGSVPTSELDGANCQVTFLLQVSTFFTSN